MALSPSSAPEAVLVDTPCKRLDLCSDTYGAREPDEDGSLLLYEYLSALDRLESVRSVRCGDLVPFVYLGQTPEQEVPVEFEHAGDEDAASEYAWSFIYQRAFGAALDAVGDRRPRSLRRPHVRRSPRSSTSMKRRRPISSASESRPH